MTRRRRPIELTAADFRASALEADLQLGIEELVGYLHGFVWHVRNTKQSPELENLTDLVILVPGAVGLLELKSQDRKLTRGQAEVAELLRTVRTGFGGIVRPNPAPGEISYDEALLLINGQLPLKT